MSDKFRVRFAPSPTGMLHIGNARTAVLNWLLARRYGGTFILRIEDTDTERSSAGSEVSILEDLRWLGLEWDEGPDLGGKHGPYRQSERGELYRAQAGNLVERGLAYYCRLSDERLEAFRAESLAAGRSPVYRGQFSGPNEKDAGPQPPAVRFKVPEGESAWRDLVKGEVSVSHETIGDFILLRADGRPTYNFAAAVDDRAMEITHVVRGDDHLSNTPRQILLHAALGGPGPLFAHIPLILGPDHQRLSKRHGATSVREFRLAGYLPEALINYLSLLSWSSPSGDEFLEKERLLAEIDFERLGKSAAVFDQTKLRWLNGRHIRSLDPDRLAGLLRVFAAERAGSFDKQRWELVCLACREKIELLSEIDSYLDVFSGRPPEIEDPEARSLLAADEARRVLSLMASILREAGKDDTEAMKALFKTVGQETGVKGKLLYMPVRIALTGSMHGPDLPMIMAVLGARRCAELLEAAVAG
ncbi:MAG: glutamate--tRNA ligase [Candidatus Glassbacteria bacterium]|nr:glutamate--tRNA ligase [Candidatus Glassbacteria bacterium]